jgi:Phage integrase, N-terminal SAM-like domain
MPTEPDGHLDPLPGLLALARERMRTRHLALRTEQAYLQWLQRYIAFHDGHDPRELGASEIERFLTQLAVQRRVSAATQNQALQALLFVYRHVLDIELPWLDNVTRATHQKRLPVVLSRACSYDARAPAAPSNPLCRHASYTTIATAFARLRLRLPERIGIAS